MALSAVISATARSILSHFPEMVNAFAEINIILLHKNALRYAEMAFILAKSSAMMVMRWMEMAAPQNAPFKLATDASTQPTLLLLLASMWEFLSMSRS